MFLEGLQREKKRNPVYFDANANFWHDLQKATGVTPPPPE